MKKKIISAALSVSMIVSAFAALSPTTYAAAKTPVWQTNVRQMEKLNRGLVAVYRTADTQNVNKTGVYLSWRLLGDEPLATAEYDIYKNDTYLATTTGAKGTNYIDEAGTVSDKYKVVLAGADAQTVAAQTSVSPTANHVAAKSQYSTLANSFTYMDVPIQRPADMKTSSGEMSYYYNLDKDHEGGANDASVGDLDGDGDYEIVLKWDPTNSKDTTNTGLSGNVYIDAYEITTDTDNLKWRIDLGPSIRAGAHDTQFLVYDFDGDGKAEVATQTAPGSKDSKGKYVTEVGDTEEIRNTDNTNIQLSKGHNIGADFYTVFDGETGEAMCTTAGIPLGSTNGSAWGDSKLQRAHRFLAAVAYIDGVHPSIVMCRGYYNRAVVRAYTWDGSDMSLQWEHDGAQKSTDSLYGQGNHNLSVSDVDNDGKDEIVYGSATLDDDGTVIGNTLLGHGDAMHVNDFNNDGIQEVFSVKEKSEGIKNNAADFRVAATGKNIFGVGASGDTGRGVMDNIDDAYAKENPNALALGWTSNHSNVFDLTGAELKAKPAGAGKGSFDNFLVYWDGDLGRELLDSNIIQKYDAANGYTTRFWGENDGYTLTGGTTNNYTKRNPCLVADLWGDWREEIIMASGKGKDETPVLRIFTSTIPTDYRLTTLMHDSQYRLAIAWQNVAYNQPPHTSYYVGSAALATDDAGNELNYLAPAVAYTTVTYEQPEQVAVTGVAFSEETVSVEVNKTVKAKAVISPENATKKKIIYSSADESIATVENGIVTGVAEGSTTITATTVDGNFTASCTVNVTARHAESVVLSESIIDTGIDYTTKLTATVKPDETSNKAVKWSSDDTKVAVVDNNGNVTGVGYGRAVITAATVDGGLTAQCVVRVKPYNQTNLNPEGNFVSDTNTSDFTGTVDGGSLNLSDSNNALNEFHKDFTVCTDDSATLNFHFTTGGVKYNGSDWNWDGHEYSFAVKMLDENGGNILTMSQAYKSSGQTLMSKVGEKDADGLISSWNKVIDSASNVQGSAKRWNVTVEFDYANDKADVTLIGTDSSWTAESAKYTTTINLGGKKLKTFRCEITKDGDGAVKAVPKLENLTYFSTKSVSGRTDTTYEKKEMTESTITEWTQESSDSASLKYDSDNGRIWYNQVKPTVGYNALKQFDINDNTLVTYDVNWYFGGNLGKDANFEYIQFGSNLRIGWANGYHTFVSTDGGANYIGIDADGNVDAAKSIFDGENETYVKNVQIIFDPTNNKINSFKFGGVQISDYTDYAMPEGTTYNSVSFGLQVGENGTSAWAYPNGIDSIKITQFAAGDDPVEEAYFKLDSKDGNKAAVSYALIDGTEDIVIIAALCDDNGNIADIKAKNIKVTQQRTNFTDEFVFDKTIGDYKVKLFMWDSLQNMKPIMKVSGDGVAADDIGGDDDLGDDDLGGDDLGGDDLGGDDLGGDDLGGDDLGGDDLSEE